MSQKFGFTGRFPGGKLSRSDEGELTFGIALDPTTNLVRVEFGEPVAWLAMPPQIAIDFAKKLLTCAGAKKIEIEL